MTERQIVQQLIEEGLTTDGLTTDGGHHKQWYLERIAAQLELPITVDYEPGIPP